MDGNSRPLICADFLCEGTANSNRKVTSTEDNSTLPGVNVLIKGTSSGTITDANGSYSLTAGPGAEVLVFSFVGFVSQEVSIAGRSVIDIGLVSDSNSYRK